MALVSVIIPCREVDIYTKRCIIACESLKEKPEIIVVTDKDCPGFPAEKRNWAMERAKGNIFAFIDSDAYPSQSWLTNALYWLQVFPAVCGPGVLPPGASFKERIADQVHKWVFCPYRVIPKSQRFVPWHPSFNLIVKKEVAVKFDPYLTGEDDKFGLRIQGGIFYSPDVLVYHNRRPAFKPLWKQFATYALHKGHFKRLAFIAWVTTLWVYAVNFIKGFFRMKL